MLSRVRTRSGLFLSKKLDFKKKFKVSEKLLSFEERMTEKEEQYLKQFHDIGGDNQIDWLTVHVKHSVINKITFTQNIFFGLFQHRLT